MVDNTIALQVRPFQMPDVGQLYGNVQNIQANRMRMAEAQEMAQERNALRGLLSSGVDPYSPEGLAQVRRTAPMLAAPFEQAAGQRAVQQAQARRYNTQADAERFKLYRGQLGGVNSQDAWTNWRSSVVQEFPQFAASIPERFSPQVREEVAGGADLLIQRATAAAAAARPNEFKQTLIAGGVLPGTPEFEAAMRQRAEYLRGVRPAAPRAPMTVRPGDTVIDETGRVIFTNPDRPRAPADFERKRDEMIARGVHPDIASGLATGQFRLSAASDGTMNVVDVGSGRVVFGPGAGGMIGQPTPPTAPTGGPTPPTGVPAAPADATAPTTRALPPPGVGTLPMTGADYRGATGAPGFVAETANTIVDLFGGRALPAPETARAAQALQNLDTRTRMFLQSAIPGRPSNYLMEMIGGLTVSPATLSLGPERSRERVQQTTRFLEATMSELENISRSRGTGQFTQQQIADANLTLNNLRSLLADYRQLEQAFERGPTSTPTPRRRGTLDRGVQTGVQPPTTPGEFRTESGFRFRPIE